MRKAMMVLGAVLIAGFAVSAQAGQATVEEVMAKMATCQACAPFMKHTEMHPSMANETFDTKTGFIQWFGVNDSKMAPTFAACMQECGGVMEQAGKWTAAERTEKLCGCCTGMMDLMARKDVTVEMFDGAMGGYVVASSTTAEGTAELHKYAKLSRDITAAHAAMQKEAAGNMAKTKG
jgi:hypothetical protein